MATKKKTDFPKVTASPPVASQKPLPDLFDKLGKKAPLLALGILSLIIFIVYYSYLTFEKVYIFKDIGSDTCNFTYPYLTTVADYITKYGVPKWSFHFGMGQSLFPFFLHDPFDIFLLLAGKSHIVFGIALKEAAKVLLAGILFFYYLKTLKLSDFTALTGSILFAFSGFVIVGGGWGIFSFEAVNMALLLLAFEQLLINKKWFLFPVAIFLISMSQPFNLYVYGFFLATYAIFRLLQLSTFSAKNAGLLFIKMIGLGLIGLLLSAPFMIEDIVQILESPRGSGTNSYAHVLSSMPMFAIADNVQLCTSILRFFSSDILGSGNDFTGWQNTLEAPLFYIGLLSLILMPQVFRFLDKKVKISFIVFISLWFLPVIFPWFRYAFWLFSGDYYRSYSIIVAFIFLYYSLLALELILQTRKINPIVLAVTLILLFILLYYPYSAGTDVLRNNAIVPVLNPKVSVFVCFMLIVYGVLLFLIGRKNSSPYLKYALLAAIVLEVTHLSGISVNDREPVQVAELSQKVGYNDYSVEAVNYIKQHDKSPFYRVDKTYGSSPAMHYSFDDAMIQDYYGTSCYNSFNQEYYIKYLQLMGISHKENEFESRWAAGVAFRPILESGNSVKYILAKTNINPNWKITCDSPITFGDVKLFRNKFVIPFGYTYSYYVKESDFDKISSVQKDFTSLRACAIQDADVSKVAGLKELPLKDSLQPAGFNTDIYRAEVNALSKDTLAITKFEETLITGKIDASEDKIMYLSVPYDAGWTLKVDGHQQDKLILDGGMTGVMLKKGPHTVEMSYQLRYFYKGLWLSLAGLVFYALLLLFAKKKTDTVVAAQAAVTKE